MKIFPNLFPEDSPRIIQRSWLVLKQGKWQEVRYKREERTASGVYNFIVTLEGIVFIRRASARVADKAISYIDLAKGENVKYAGRLYFQDALIKASSASGLMNLDIRHLQNSNILW